MFDDTKTDAARNKNGYVAILPHSVAVLVKSRDVSRGKCGILHHSGEQEVKLRAVKGRHEGVAVIVKGGVPATPG